MKHYPNVAIVSVQILSFSYLNAQYPYFTYLYILTNLISLKEVILWTSTIAKTLMSVSSFIINRSSYSRFRSCLNYWWAIKLSLNIQLSSIPWHSHDIHKILKSKLNCHENQQTFTKNVFLKLMSLSLLQISLCSLMAPKILRSKDLKKNFLRNLQILFPSEFRKIQNMDHPKLFGRSMETDFTRNWKVCENSLLHIPFTYRTSHFDTPNILEIITSL